MFFCIFFYQITLLRKWVRHTFHLHMRRDTHNGISLNTDSGDSRIHIYPNGLIACTKHDWGFCTGIHHRAEVYPTRFIPKTEYFIQVQEQNLYYTELAMHIQHFQYFNTLIPINTVSFKYFK